MNRTPLGSLWTLGALTAVGGLSLLTGTGISASEVLDQWYWRNPYPTGNDLYGVAYGNAIFVTVGQGGTIMTSTNSHGWEHRESGTDKQLNQVIFAQDMFLAIGESGVILSSTDGTNWVSHPTNPLYSLRGVTFAQGKYVIVGGNGDSQQPGPIILYSDRLTQWSSREFPSTDALSRVNYGNGVFMAVGGGGGSSLVKGTILISSNGLDWNAVGRDDMLGLNSVAFGNGKFVIGGDFGEIWSTADGTDWLHQSTGVPTMLLGVSWVDNQFLMVGGRSTILLSSPDGTNWAERESAATDSLYAVAGGDDHYVAVGQHGQIVSSTNSQSWSSETTYLFGHPNWFSAVAFGKGRFVAVGSDWIGTSTNGVAWASVSTTSPAWLTDVIFGGDRFLAVGAKGNILWSGDGISWQSTAIAPDIQLNSAAYGNGIYLANGISSKTGYNQAWLLSSTNLTEWETVYHSTNVFPDTIVYGNGRFVAGAPNQFLALVSTNGWDWTEASTGSVGISDIVFANDKFVAIEGQSTNGVDWTFNSPQDRFFASENGLADTAFGDGVFVTLKSRDLGHVSGNGGILFGSGPGSVWTSTNGVRWTRRIASSLAFYDVAYGNGTFVAVGEHTAIVQSANLASLLPIRLSGTIATAQMFNLGITSAAGLALTVEISSDLQTWQTLRTLVNESGQTNLLESVLATSGQRFYRARTSN